MDRDKEMEMFLAESEDFIEDFEPKFVDYFVSMSLAFNKHYEKQMLEEVALLVYKDVLNIDIFMSTIEHETFDEMIDDGFKIGFVINRCLLYLLEKYVIFGQSRKDFDFKNITTLILCISEYVNQFEKQICEKNMIPPQHVDFDTIDNFSAGHNILDIFRSIKDNGEEITFFNLYNGIPVKHTAIVTDIDEEDVAFKTMQAQEIAMKMDGKAYILKDKNFHKYIQADIVYSNFSNNSIVLSNFTYLLNMPAANRKFIRVPPEIMAEVSLFGEKKLITRGKLFDLSINGLGVISGENNGIYAGAKIELSFPLELPNSKDESLITVEGKVLNIIEYSSSYRYCIQIYPKIEIKEKIKNYVKVREGEILENLNKEVNNYIF